MALMGDSRPESEAIAWGVQRHVRQLILGAIPASRGKSITVGSLAMRLDIAHHRVRSVLRQLEGAREICSTNGNGVTRYHRNDKEANTMTDTIPDTRHTRDQVLDVLESNLGEKLTILELAQRLGMDSKPAAIASAVKKLVDDDTIQREGLGKRGDPFRHFVDPVADGTENEAPERAEADDLGATDSPAPPDPELEEATLEEAVDAMGAHLDKLDGGPGPRGESPLQAVVDLVRDHDRRAPVVDAIFPDVAASVAYTVAAKDLRRRAQETQAEAEVLDAGATLLERLAEEALEDSMAARAAQ